MGRPLDRITIEGYRSIRKLDNFELRPLNILIGANGSGKSNFVGFFRFLREMVEQRLQLTLQTMEGGADGCLHLGPKITSRLAARFVFGRNGYRFVLVPTTDNRFIFEAEVTEDVLTSDIVLGQGHAESLLKDRKDSPGRSGAPVGVPFYVYKDVSSWVVYHFHDTGLHASVRRQHSINDNEYLRHDAANLAAFLYGMPSTQYQWIRDVIRLAAPFFDDFDLRPIRTRPDEIQLEWRQTNSEFPFRAQHLSDGTLRFICLATALLQPSPPATLIFDEPELGLHPYALTILADLFRKVASPRRRIIVATQSPMLLSAFEPEDVIVVERSGSESVFNRLDSASLSEWLSEYSLGDLWLKNVIGGRPGAEGLGGEESS